MSPSNLEAAIRSRRGRLRTLVSELKVAARGGSVPFADILLASLRGQLRCYRMVTAPFGVDAPASARLLSYGWTFCQADTSAAVRAGLAPEIVKDAQAVLNSWPESQAPDQTRKDIFG